MKKIYILILMLNFSLAYSMEYQYILNDHCINILYNFACKSFKSTPIEPLKDARGIILRIRFDNFDYNLIKNIKSVEKFLAKIENPVIIEVHTNKILKNEYAKVRNWEASTIIANDIEAILLESDSGLNRGKINSVGYGEFLPAKNTSNNGGKDSNRVDIIVLCSISGE